MKFTDRFTQALCPVGIQKRESLETMEPDLPPREKYSIIQAYFYHKNHCPDCSTTWHEIKP